MCKMPSQQQLFLLQQADKIMARARETPASMESKERIAAANREAAKNVLLGIQLQLARRVIR